MSSMKAVVFQAADQPLTVADLPQPQPGPHQIQVRVRACGICGSDLHFARSGNAKRNTVFGHELAGEITAVGSDVSNWQVGDRVVPMAFTSCRQCGPCLAGDNMYCEHIESIGFSDQRNGAYAEYVVTGAHDALPLPSDNSFAEGAAVEPMATGYDAVRRSKLDMNDNVLIIGAGPIGLAIAAWARHFGATHVVVSEPNQTRLARAQAMGATATINPHEQEDVMAAYERATGTRPNVIFEAVDIPGMIQRCVDMAEPDSRIVVVGVCQQADSFLPLQCIAKRLQLIFAYGYNLGDFQQILALMGQGRIDVAPLISHRIGLNELPAMFEAMHHPSDQIKVIIEP